MHDSVVGTAFASFQRSIPYIADAYGAGIDGPSITQYGAGAAIAGPATQLRRLKTQIVTQDEEERCRRRRVHPERLAVYL